MSRRGGSRTLGLRIAAAAIGLGSLAGLVLQRPRAAKLLPPVVATLVAVGLALHWGERRRRMPRGAAVALGAAVTSAVLLLAMSWAGHVAYAAPPALGIGFRQGLILGVIAALLLYAFFKPEWILRRRQAQVGAAQGESAHSA